MHATQSPSHCELRSKDTLEAGACSAQAMSCARHLQTTRVLSAAYLLQLNATTKSKRVAFGNYAKKATQFLHISCNRKAWPFHFTRQPHKMSIRSSLSGNAAITSTTQAEHPAQSRQPRHRSHRSLPGRSLGCSPCHTRPAGKAHRYVPGVLRP